MKKRLRDRLPRFTLIELVIVLAIVGILVTLVVAPGHEERCQDLCQMLDKKKVGTARNTCICENRETGERDAYPLKSW